MLLKRIIKKITAATNDLATSIKQLTRRKKNVSGCAEPYQQLVKLLLSGPPLTTHTVTSYDISCQQFTPVKPPASKSTPFFLLPHAYFAQDNSVNT